MLKLGYHRSLKIPGNFCVNYAKDVDFIRQEIICKIKSY